MQDAYESYNIWLATKPDKRLQVGQRVKIAVIAPGKPITPFGTVVPTTLTYPGSVEVRRDGSKKSQSYHPSFLTPVENSNSVGGSSRAGHRDGYVYCTKCRDIVIQYTPSLLMESDMTYICMKGHKNRVLTTCGDTTAGGVKYD